VAISTLQEHLFGILLGAPGRTTYLHGDLLLRVRVLERSPIQNLDSKRAARLIVDGPLDPALHKDRKRYRARRQRQHQKRGHEQQRGQLCRPVGRAGWTGGYRAPASRRTTLRRARRTAGAPGCHPLVVTTPQSAASHRPRHRKNRRQRPTAHTTKSQPSGSGRLPPRRPATAPRRSVEYPICARRPPTPPLAPEPRRAQSRRHTPACADAHADARTRSTGAHCAPRRHGRRPHRARTRGAPDG